MPQVNIGEGNPVGRARHNFQTGAWYLSLGMTADSYFLTRRHLLRLLSHPLRKDRPVNISPEFREAESVTGDSHRNDIDSRRLRA